ncbi:MAG: HlyD family secretion protein [Acetobacteraceae bacterium]|nr:HlyD family secretion protein [Acetobacteraceae bacterium]
MTDQDGTAQRSLEDRQSEAGETEALHEDEDHEAVSRPPAKKEAAPPAEAKPGETPAPKKRPWVRIILILVALAAVIGGVTYWFLTRNEESTDDAYTDGRAVAIASHVSGYVTALNVRDNQFVHKGDVLVEIDPRDYIAARDQAQGNLLSTQGQLEGARYSSEVARKNFPARLGQAQAQLQAAKATLFKAQNDYNRQHSLPKGATTQQEVDAATAALQSAQGQVAEAEAQVQQATPVQANIGETDSRVDQLAGIEKQAQAQLDQANLNLAWTKVTAPQDGWITKRNVELGNFVQSGQSLFSLVTPEVWITANFKESQLARMRPGQRVDIEVDGYPDLKLKGHLDSIQLGSGSKFSAFPAENATGNFVKIVQRVPVKIVIDSGLDPNRPLPLGLSVVPIVHFE